MPSPIRTGPRVVVSVTATESGDWQVVSTPTGFQGITTGAGFADNDYLHGFVRFENGEDWEEYDTEDDTNTGLLQISNITGTVTIARPATPYKSSNSGSRVAAGSGTHTLAVSLGSGTMKRILREINGSWKTFTSGDATPSVADYRLFITAGTTAITAFDDMEDGKLFCVQRGASDIVITDGASIELGGRNLTLTAVNPAAFFANNNGVAVLVGFGDNIRADLASTANGYGASLIGVEDSGSLLTATTVEAALAELRKNAFISGGTVAADGNDEITVAPRRRYQLTNADSVAGVIGLADGEFCQIIAPASGSAVLQDGGTTTSGQALALSGADLTLESTDESVYVLTRVGSEIRVSGGAGAAEYAADDLRTFGAVIDGSTDDTTAWNNAIAALNAGTINRIFHPGGTSIVSGSGALTTITAAYGAIVGVGPTSIVKKNSSATDGSFLAVTQTASDDRGITIADLRFIIDSSASVSSDDYLLDITYARNLSMQRVTGNNIASSVKITKGGLMSFRDCVLECEKGGNAAANIYLGDVSTIVFDNFAIITNGNNVVSNTNTTGKMIHLQTTPATSGSIDTVWFINCSFQLFDSGTPGSGKPYGLYIDRVNTSGNSSVTNLWWINSYIDHTTVAAVIDVDGASSGSDSRMWAFRNFRFTTDAGDGIVLQHNATTPQDRADMTFSDGYICIKDDSQAFSVTGNDYDNCRFTDNTLVYRTTTAKEKMVSLDANGWTVSDISIQPDSDSTETPAIPTVGVQIEDETLSEIYVESINAPEIAEDIREPVGVQAASNARTVITTRQRRNLDHRRRMVHHEDFFGPSSLGAFQTVSGSDSNALDAAITANQINGIATLSFGNGGTKTMAVNGSQITYGSYNFRANVGGLRMTVRCRANDTDGLVFLGFTDSTALEAPFELVATTLTSTATDAFGLLYDDSATSGNWQLVGVASDVDATHADSGVAFDTTTKIYEIEIDTAGTMKAWINGVYVGSISSAVTVSTLLTPYVGGFSRGGTISFTVDYVTIEQDRY